jgi:hypothetical protein
MQATREYVFKTHRLPQIAELAQMTNLDRRKCSSICEVLIGQRQLYLVFEGKGLPKVVIPYDMMESVLRTQPRPHWVPKYEFPDKAKYYRKLEELQRELSQAEQFERLLYSTDVPLEEAVASALEYLEFQDVRHHKENRDNPDITFTHKGIYALVEVEGPSGPGDKEKANQLGGWLKRSVEEEGRDARELQGIYVLNHFRGDDPESREDPLTQHAVQYLRIYGSRLLTTKTLFQLVRDVRNGDLAKDQARDRAWEGDPF